MSSYIVGFDETMTEASKSDPSYGIEYSYSNFRLFMNICWTLYNYILELVKIINLNNLEIKAVEMEKKVLEKRLQEQDRVIEDINNQCYDYRTGFIKYKSAYTELKRDYIELETQLNSVIAMRSFNR